MLETWLTWKASNFVNIGGLLTKPAPIERARSGLSIGTIFVKNQPMLTKLWSLKANHVNNQDRNPSKFGSKKTVTILYELIVPCFASLQDSVHGLRYAFLHQRIQRNSTMAYPYHTVNSCKIVTFCWTQVLKGSEPGC